MIKGLHHISVYAKDTEKSLDFYLNTLGFELIDREDDCTFGGFCLIRLGNCTIELITPPEGADYVSWEIPEKEPVLSHFGMDVENVEELYNTLLAKGVQIRSNGIDVLPKPLDGGRAFSIYGP
ncbi:MAG TPA: VOC family protein, partial [Candidatus Pullichristensenella excrementigallinarum]|nr:VOC family protein [Candidatus Pullichristensenella excrementigallinarum]